MCGVEKGRRPEDAPRGFSEVIHLVFEMGPHWPEGQLGIRLSLLSQAWDYKSTCRPALLNLGLPACKVGTLLIPISEASSTVKVI